MVEIYYDDELEMTKGLDAGEVSESEPAAATKRAARRELIRRLATAAAVPAVVAVAAGVPRPAAAY
jgi:hypothetical protein